MSALPPTFVRYEGLEQPMAIYVIAYGFVSPESRRLRKLFTAPEFGSGYWDCLDSTYLVVTRKPPNQIRDELKQYLKDDRAKSQCPPFLVYMIDHYWDSIVQESIQ